MPYIITFLLTLLVVSTESCNKESTQAPAETNIEELIKATELKEGVQNGVFALSKNVNWRYRMYVPEIKKEAKVPLIIALHWAGSSYTYQEYMNCLAMPGLKDLGGIIFAPEDLGSLWWQSKNEKRIIDFVTAATKHLPIDEKKIVVTGYSNGGTGSWFFANEYSNIFSAAIPMASSFLPTDDIKLPIYTIHGNEDELFPLDNLKEQIDPFSADIKLVIAEGFSHYMACAYVDYLKAAGVWLEEEVW